jgi:hypothetical protein
MEEPASNRYRPPDAAVADISPDDDATPIPMLANIGVGLLWIHFTIDLIGSAVQLPEILELRREHGTALVTGAISAVVVFTLLVAGLIHLISRRRHWARVIYLVFYLIGIPFFLMAIVETFESSVATGVGASVKTTIQAVALVLLFLPSSNGWFRQGRLT